jgi:acyl-homoserine lactone acylase PvdQ
MLRRTSTLSAAAAIVVASFLIAPSAESSPRIATSRASASASRAPAEHLTARSALPPGESGDFPISDQAAYEANGKPSDFGPHVDDQRAMYWDNRTKSDDFAKPTGTPATPKSGVRIYRDSYDVPLIYGSNGYNVWYGAGYAAATDRLFEMDAIRRLAEGRLGELTGASAVPADLQERILTYTNHQYSRMFHHLDKRGRQAIAGYAAGVEKRIQQVRANPSLLPGEYVLLSSLPAAWTVRDTMAAGVFITRDIATQGGQEMANVATLRKLEHRYGKANGRVIFSDLFPDDEADAAVTIAGRSFSNLPAGDRSTADQARDATKAMNYSAHITLSLATGPGTGNSPVPKATNHTAAAVPAGTAAKVRRADASIETWGRDLHGGSFAYAISGSRTRSGHAMVVSNPQLDYSYPSELYELEVHGGGYDARGIGVPGIPTVGIGHTAKVAWALTTGYSKTIDSFIETTRRNPRRGGPPQYLHNGKWHNESCRTVAVNYRATGPEGVPVGPANQSEKSRVCRTVHGPVVATTKNGKHARSVDYAQWMHDDQTVEGILDWDRAKNLRQVEAGVKKVRWNENIIAADSAGHIGYWHPGRYFARSAGIDQRFPLRGTGSQDEHGYLPFRRMPHVIDPRAGYVANWNTRPADGWVDGDLSGTNTRPAGPANRVVDLQNLLAAGHHFTPTSLARIDERVGEDDHRYVGYRPLLLNLRHASALTGIERRALHLMLHWDGRAYAPGAKGGSSPRSTPAAQTTDGPAATVFVAFAKRIKGLLFHSLPASVRARLDTLSTESHQYDVTPLDNDALGILIPGFSSLQPLGPKRRIAVERNALFEAVTAMRRQYGAKPSTWRRHHGISHIDSLSGVVGPSTVEPFQDRGTWVQEVAFTTGRPRR